MNSNVSLKKKANLDKARNPPSTPPCKNIRADLSSTPQPTKTAKSASKRSLEKTPRKLIHKKSSSVQAEERSVNYPSPCKSRLDFSAIPTPSIDVKSCQADILRFKNQEKKDQLAERKIMTEEWVKAKQTLKENELRDILKHQENMTLEKIELKRLILEKEKNLKVQEQKEKVLDFFALKEARKKLKEEEKQRELDYIRIEREKSIKKQNEIEEKREKERNEREEKRKLFLESVSAAKRAQEEESLRIKKELEYEQAQEMLGLRELTLKKSVNQRCSLEKAGLILN